MTALPAVQDAPHYAGAGDQEPRRVALEPRFLLELKSLVTIDSRVHEVDRRLAGRWWFIDVETNEPLRLTDRELADKQSKGRFFVSWRKDMPDWGSGQLSPLITGPAGHQANLRKSAYVEACLRTPGYCLSRRVLKPVIAALAEERGEAAPGFTTVRAWIKTFQLLGDTHGTAAFTDRFHLRGRRGSRLADYQEKAIEIGISRFLRPGSTMVASYAAVHRAVRIFEANHRRLIDKYGLGPRLVDENFRLRPPSLRTFERRCNAIDPFVREVARKGMASAIQKFRTWTTTALTDRPYAEVEVDHATVDVLLIDPSGLILGRADVIVFRDRATGMILGCSVGFDQPSYASFLNGLRHAMYPKDITRFSKISNPWPCFGRIGSLHVDNALHFIGDNILAAGRELNFNVTRLQPRQPWLKGALERFFRSINQGFGHGLPGTTLSSASARQDHEHLGKPTLTLEEFEALLFFWICDIYHAGRRKALGPIRGMGGSPLKAWREKVANYETPVLPPPELFIKLAGDRDRRTIQRNGITWDYITYESADLTRVRAHPDHKMRAMGQAAETYEVIRDPHDLGQIHLVDHHTKTHLTIPATVAHRAYASGLTLHQHQVVVAHTKRRNDGDDFEALVRARDELASVVDKLRKHPSRKQIERRVARFLEGDRSRRLRSSIEVLAPAEPSPSGMLDFDPPDFSQRPNTPAAKPTPAEVGAVKWIEAMPAPAIAPIDVEDADDDLAELKARKGWRTTNDR